jgi:hypothetical protein
MDAFKMISRVRFSPSLRIGLIRLVVMTGVMITTVARGQSDGGADPSDPTQVTFHVMQEWEWNQLSENQGDTIAYKISPFIPIKIADQSLLSNFEVPLTHAGTDLLGDHRCRGLPWGCELLAEASNSYPRLT